MYLTPKYCLGLTEVLFVLSFCRDLYYAFRNSNKSLILKPNTIFFKNYFFPSAIIEWNKLDPNLPSTIATMFLKVKY